MGDHRWSPSALKSALSWQSLMALFVVVESILFTTRVYTNHLYIVTYWRQLGIPLITAFAAIALIRSRGRWRSGVWIAALYFAWYVAAVVLNGRFFSEEFSDYERSVYRLLFVALVCFPLGGLLRDGNRERCMRFVFCASTAWITCLSAAGIYCALSQTTWVSPANGAVLGVFDSGSGYRLQLFIHANISAAPMATSLPLSVYLFLSAKHGAEKIWHMLCAGILFVALALTVSRTSIAAASVALALLPFLLLQKRLCRASAAKRWFISVAGAGVSAALCYAGSQIVTWIVAEKIISQRGLFAELHTVGSRFVAWDGAMRGIAANPSILFRGTTYERVMVAVNPFVQRADVQLGNMHNSYLQVLMAAGLPGLILLMTWLVQIMRGSFRLALHADASIGTAERFLPAVLLASVIIGTMEALFFSGQYAADRIFFLVAGYVMAYNRS